MVEYRKRENGNSYPIRSGTGQIARMMRETKRKPFVIATIDEGEVQVYAMNLSEAVQIAKRDYGDSFLEVFPGRASD
jgi:hypothetical protein